MIELQPFVHQHATCMEIQRAIGFMIEYYQHNIHLIKNLLLSDTFG
jgi:hypothetical protein